MQFLPFLFILSILLYLVSARPVSHPDHPIGSPTSQSDVKVVYEPSLLHGLPARALDLLSRGSSLWLHSRSKNSKSKPPSRKVLTRSRTSASTRQSTKQKTYSKGKTTRTVAKSCAYNPGRGRKLFGRVDDCNDEDIHLTLNNHHDGESVTETIKAGSPNLGEGASSFNNAGVYKINKWGDQQGPFIAKKFHTENEMKKEADNLHAVGHLIAKGDASNPWVVMKHAPGIPLTKTPEYAKALASKTEDCHAFMESRHEELSTAVSTLARKSQLVHTDLKDENVHWTFDEQGKGSANLLDFGQMKPVRHAKNMFQAMLKVPEKDATVEKYAMHRAAKIYSTDKCQ